MKKQSGFTLIELVMVIVILGVLSAFALPRFADFGRDARTASVNALGGAIRASANIAHAQFLADGGAGATVSLEGTPIALANGYPTIAGIVTAAQVDTTNDYKTFDPGNTPADRTFYLTPDTGSTSTVLCRVTYAEAAASAAPIVTVDISGC
jgi:MSHA pilin protein MshA